VKLFCEADKRAATKLWKTNISFQRIREQLRISTRDVETFYFWPKKRSTKMHGTLRKRRAT